MTVYLFERITRKAIFWAILAWMIANPLAQAVGETPDRTIRFKVYTMMDQTKPMEDQIELSEIYFRLGAKYIPLKYSYAYLTKQQKASVGKDFILYRSSVNADGETIYTVAARSRIKSSATELFVFLFPKKDSLNMLAIDTSKNVFEEGHMLMLNTFSKPLVVDVNSKKVGIKAKSSKLLKYKISPTGSIRIELRDATKKGYPAITNKMIGGKQGQRLIAVFYAPMKGSPRIMIQRGVDDQTVRYSAPQ